MVLLCKISPKTPQSMEPLDRKRANLLVLLLFVDTHTHTRRSPSFIFHFLPRAPPNIC